MGPGSVVMRIRRSDVDPSRDIQVHDTDIDFGFFEEEHLLEGVI